MAKNADAVYPPQGQFPSCTFHKIWTVMGMYFLIGDVN